MHNWLCKEIIEETFYKEESLMGMSISDETIDKLGTYFVHFNIHARYDIPFHRFVDMVSTGQWARVAN